MASPAQILANRENAQAQLRTEDTRRQAGLQPQLDASRTHRHADRHARRRRRSLRRTPRRNAAARTVPLTKQSGYW